MLYGRLESRDNDQLWGWLTKHFICSTVGGSDDTSDVVFCEIWFQIPDIFPLAFARDNCFKLGKISFLRCTLAHLSDLINLKPTVSALTRIHHFASPPPPRFVFLCWLEMINVYVRSDAKKENQCKPAINDIFLFCAESCVKKIEICCQHFVGFRGNSFVLLFSIRWKAQMIL